MTANQGNTAEVSAAFFCPQTKRADEDYLDRLHAFLSRNRLGQILLGHIAALADEQLWGLYALSNDRVRKLSHGPQVLDTLRAWALNGLSGPLSMIQSNITSLPLLAVLQIGQYLLYLETNAISHADFMASIRDGGGGVHGYCGGLPAALCIALARTEDEILTHMGTALKVLVGIGAYTEAADESSGSDNTLLAIRLKHEDQGQQLIDRFPGTYISAITAPKSISVGGPAAILKRFARYVTENEGVRTQEIHLGGSAHNPENAELASELCTVLRQSRQNLQLPDASDLLLPLRTNQTGERLLHGSLTDDLVWTMLAARCEWLRLLKGVALDLSKSPRKKHRFAVFGWDDCVTMSVFHQARLQITKVFAKSLILEHTPLPLGEDPERHHANEAMTYNFPEHSIAIVGAACRLPGANNMAELWDLVASGKSCVQEVPSERIETSASLRVSRSGSLMQGRILYGNFIEDVKRFDHAFFGINAREAANMDPQQRIMLELSFEALEDAGYLAFHQREAGDDVGCFIGLVLGEYVENTNSHAPTAYTSTGTVPAFVCGRLSHTYGWSGPSEMFNTACSSSMVAINRACKAIQAGECRMALAGGANVMTGVNTYLDLAKAGFLSPTGQCKPFSASGDGYCRSDGCGLVVLKSLKHAIADGDAVWGVIPGVATNQGGLSKSLTIPDTNAQQALYRKVLRQAGLQADHITYVEAHGTGTQVGDPIEMDSIRSVFGSESRRQKLYVGSIKGNIGHAEPAAGIAGLLKALVMIRHRQIPPQASHSMLNPRIPPLERDGMAISEGLVQWTDRHRAVLVNSYGAAGSNGALICCGAIQRGTRSEAAYSKTRSKDSPVSFPIAVTAASQESLIKTARNLGVYLEKQAADGDICLADIAFTLNQRRQRQMYFAHVKADSMKEASRLLQCVDSSKISRFPGGPSPPKPVILVFSGQTADTIALPKPFYDNFPAFRSYLDACDVEFRKVTARPLLPAIFQENVVSDIAALQCGILAVQYSSARCWIDAGIQPCAVIGHSIGELTALTVSGVLSLADAITLVAMRGRLIEDNWGPDKGSMLALECTLEEAEELFSLVHNVEIACHNGPSSLVLTGTTTAIQAAEDILHTQTLLRKIRFQRINTSHGFHSALTEPILADLSVVANSLTWNEPSIPLYTCSSAEFVPHGQHAVRHARQSVKFFKAIRNIEDDFGSCVWLEAGLDTPVIAMTRRSCRQPDGHTFQSVKTQGHRCPTDTVADAVIDLWHGGTFVNHWGLLSGSGDDSQAPRPVWLPPYQFAETRHWLDNVDRAWELQAQLQLQPDGGLNRTESSSLREQPLICRRQTPIPQMIGNEFVVNTRNARYRSVVQGHVVCSRPLCPAPMHMELATTALSMLAESYQKFKNKTLVFQNFVVRAPLGLEPQGDVVLRLEEVPDQQETWKLKIVSNSSTMSSLETGTLLGETVHVESVITVSAETVLDGYQRIVSRQKQRLLSSDTSERWKGGRAYKAFARVVEYHDFFKGMISVQLEENEAVAKVEIPQNQPHRCESTTWRKCDAVVLDTCIHIGGLLINTSDAISNDDVAVMVGLNRSVISPSFTMDSGTKWSVYATCEFSDDQNQAFGDIFVFSQEDDLVAMFSGCRMSRVPIVKLEKALDSTLSTSRRAKIEAGPDQLPPMSHSSTRISSTHGINTPSSQAQQSNELPQHRVDAVEALRQLISDSTMIDKADVSESMSLALMGIDSLGSTELSEELASRFGLAVDSIALLDNTLADLVRMINPVQMEPVSARKPTEDVPVIVNIGVDEKKVDVFFKILTEVSGTPRDDIQSNTMLADLGVDSLSLMDLKQELEEKFPVILDVQMAATVQEIMAALSLDPVKQLSLANVPPQAQQPPTKQGDLLKSLFQINPFHVMEQLGLKFDEAASENGILGYWNNVAPLQDEITVAHIVEAFASFGVDFKVLESGQPVSDFPYLSPKYDKLVRRCWEFLQKQDIISISEEMLDVGQRKSPRVVRGSKSINPKPAAELLRDFHSQFPAYTHETKLMELTGPKLADCLSGSVDSVSLMFGSAQSSQIMENYYSCSPLTKCLTTQLISLLTTLLLSPTARAVDRPVRILEVGAGTGGTTRLLAAVLDKYSIATEYTFTDISPTLVKKAKSKFQHQFPWIKYSTLNLEVDVGSEFLGQFDVVVATNVVHATRDRTAACRRIRETLTPAGGLFILAETTTKINWCDICFGLLDGWWFSDGPIGPLQTAHEWVESLREAGFASVGYSRGSTADVNTVQLVVGSNADWPATFAATTAPRHMSDLDTSARLEPKGKPRAGGYHLETMVYKEAEGVPIHADVYYPQSTPSSRMPIALMIHGGGYVTLSRRAVRPEQTRYLLKRGLLPVSIDYRLCPEVNMIDGPMTDVRDAYRWSRDILPGIASNAGVLVDRSRIVAIGWSTGGQLAMSLGWTAEYAGLPPPSAVLSFYAPVDFESRELDSAKFIASLPEQNLSLDHIINMLPNKPVTNSNCTGDTSDMGWVRPGDPRADLLITMSQQGIALPILLNGLCSERPGKRIPNLDEPSPERIAFISPLAHLRLGTYNVPTFIIHGTNDEVAPFAAAKHFAESFERNGKKGIQCGFLPLQDAGHLFDLRLAEGSGGWEAMVAPGYQFLLQQLNIT